MSKNYQYIVLEKTIYVITHNSNDLFDEKPNSTIYR